MRNWKRTFETAAWYSTLFMLAILAGITLHGCSVPSLSYDPYESVCQLRVSGSQGSGTLVSLNGDKGLVLTCRHVAESVGNHISVEWLAAGGEKTSGEVVRVTNGGGFDTDMALIVCDAPQGVHPLPVAEFDPDAGPWYSVGFRGGVMYESVATKASQRDDGLIVLNEPFIQGQSGGAVIDSRGYVVGIVVGSDLKTFGVASDGDNLSSLVSEFQSQ